MTIQEYIRKAVNGFPKEEVRYYRLYFTQMDCKWCMYNGYACKHPKRDGVCIDYRVEKRDLEFIPTGQHEEKV